MLKNDFFFSRLSHKKILYAYFSGLFGIANDFFTFFQRSLIIIAKRKSNKYKRMIERITKYSCDDFLNAFSVAALLQIAIKLILSIFYFAMPLGWVYNLFLLFFLTFFCLKKNVFFFFHQLLMNFFKFNVHPEIYDNHLPDDLDFNELTKEELLEFNINQNKEKFRIYFFFEKTLNFFIFLRLCFFYNPLFFNLFKFILFYCFLCDYHLFFTYFFSFLFILSRFIFFLSDNSFYELKKSLIQTNLLQNSRSVIKVTKNNIFFFSSWILRIIETKERHEMYKKNNKLYLLNGYYFNYIKNILEKKNINIKIDQKNFYILKTNSLLIFFILFFLFCPFEKIKTVKNVSTEICDVILPNINLMKPFVAVFTKPIRNHGGLKKTVEFNDGSFEQEINVLTTIRLPCPPFQLVLLSVPKVNVPIGKNSQGISLQKYIQKISPPIPLSKNNIVNKHYSNLTPADVKNVENILKNQRSIDINLDYIQNLNQESLDYILELSTIKTFNQPLPIEIQQTLHAPINPYLESKEKDALFNIAIHFAKEENNPYKAEFANINSTMLNCSHNLYKGPHKIQNYHEVGTNESFDKMYNHCIHALSEFQKKNNLTTIYIPQTAVSIKKTETQLYLKGSMSSNEADIDD